MIYGSLDYDIIVNMTFITTSYPVWLSFRVSVSFPLMHLISPHLRTPSILFNWKTYIYKLEKHFALISICKSYIYYSIRLDYP